MYLILQFVTELKNWKTCLRSSIATYLFTLKMINFQDDRNNISREITFYV